ncbi:MAG TPA: hypothetical protein VMC05_08020 [Xanthobacteraceae bacterium]|nr:hypothetical protein [Xanthobacteraceae bacterium]
MAGKISGVFQLVFALGVCAAAGPCFAQSKPVVLITADEAKRPRQETANLAFRAGISRGPAINLLTPQAPAALHSPIHLQLKFAAHGGAKIDQASVKLTDVVVPALDLTDRVKGFTKPDGIDVPEAEIPPGTYTLRAEIRDSDGHPGSLTFTLNVAKP